jgi:hypothetical protein
MGVIRSIDTQQSTQQPEPIQNVQFTFFGSSIPTSLCHHVTTCFEL